MCLCVFPLWHYTLISCENTLATANFEVASDIIFLLILILLCQLNQQVFIESERPTAADISQFVLQVPKLNMAGCNTLLPGLVVLDGSVMLQLD